MPARRAGNQTLPGRYHGHVRTLESKLPSSAVSIFEVMSRLARERQAINLSQGFPDFGTSPALVESVAHYMREGFNQYAPMPGVLALRQALATKIERLYGRRYDPETEIAITTGATEGLFATLTALVHPGDEVVLFQPAYDSYTPAIQLSGGVPRYVTLRYPDYRIDWDEVRRTVTARTRVIVLNTPHNPTGMVWTRGRHARPRGGAGAHRCHRGVGRSLRTRPLRRRASREPGALSRTSRRAPS